MPPPFGPTMKNFLQATLYEKVRFSPFFSKNCKIQQCLTVFCVPKFQKSGRICGFHWTFRSKKCFSFREASPPWLPDQGLCPWTPLGAPPSDPRYRLALCALAMPPLCQILNTSLSAHHTLGGALSAPILGGPLLREGRGREDGRTREGGQRGRTGRERETRPCLSCCLMWRINVFNWNF